MITTELPIGIHLFEVALRGVGLHMNFFHVIDHEHVCNLNFQVGFNKNSGHYISIRKNKVKEGSIPDDYQRLQSLKAEERFVTPLLLNCESSRLAAEARVYEREEELLRALKEELVSLLESVREYSQAVAALDVLCTFAGIFYSSAWTRFMIFISL